VIPIDLSGKGVLVTGATRGLGKAIAMEFSRAGARVFVTHRWGSVDEASLAAEFVEEGLPAPRIVEADASDREATRLLMREIHASAGNLHVVVSNVAFSKIVRDLSDMKKNALDLSLGYSAWPVVDLVQASHEIFGCFPRYVVGISGDGAAVCQQGYELAGVSKAVLETLCRYLAVRLKTEGVRVNALRPSALDTESARDTFGEETMALVREKVGAAFLDPRAVARACLALCSGLMDSVTGQTLVVDEGWSLVSPIQYITGTEVPFEFPKDDAR
jgi:NAD(P)-dependent dehydrogenase (short-subunit alcohol dehydrogenase family)